MPSLYNACYHKCPFHSLCANCSVGDISIPDSEVSIHTAPGMITILPDEVSCSGILTSWEVCGYFRSSIVGLQVGVYRPMEEANRQIHFVNLFMAPSMFENYTCFTRNDSAKVGVQAEYLQWSIAALCLLVLQ